VTLALAFWLLLATGAFGSVLAALHLRGTPPSWTAGAIHGLLGFLGLVALAVSLRGPPRGVAMGVASFGAVSGALIAVALAVGLAMPLLRSRLPRIPGGLIGVHVTIAISGIVILAAYVLL
jgi:hypothetical protein